MIESKAEECLKALRGDLLSGQASQTFRGVSIDTRTLKAGQLFFCIQGPRFDGHGFIQQAIDKNAAGIILSAREKLPWSLASEKKPADAPFVIRVDDTLSALQNLARFHRSQMPARIVGVTGTNGKSTTKEMIASISETTYKTLKTRGNLNNHIGLPLNVLELDASHEVAVLEMGMSAAGEIRQLADIAKPDIGIITNISEGHLVQLKTLKNVQAAKGELFEALDEQATAIVNADDPLVLELALSLRAKRMTFAIDHPADVKADNIQANPKNGHDFTVSLFDKSFSVTLPFLGFCNIYNALAAVAAGHSLGIPTTAMAEGLAHCKLLSQRYEIFQHRSMIIINDAYNANPQSMKEALTTLTGYHSSGRKLFVIGDMLELGDLSQSAHQDLGKEIAGQSVDILVAVGELASLATQEARTKGMAEDSALAFENREEASQYLIKNTRPGDCLLFKGSRGAGMEKVIQALVNSKSN
ncbi:MAG: UDP-N-acetylmuramoyl-tripeptide--D-alanyl-D-alanine ligase [Nitrospinaceae bacterium]|nr:MAG: UDP-N-acetylmuramoyl-tripeptide--D-alanyl-D-alanine ligase [Nitrospinaceae bacterium]